MKNYLVFDLETTGTDKENDRIVQIAARLFSPGGELLSSIKHYINPTIPIPEQATAVHKITDEMVKGSPLFKDVVDEYFELFNNPNNILSGFNIINFDIPVLYKEFSRCNLNWSVLGREICDVGNLVKVFFPRTQEAMFYQVTGKTIAEVYGSAHDADADLNASWVLWSHIRDMYSKELYNKEFVKDLPEPDVFDYEQQLAKISRFGGEMLDIAGKFKMVDGQVCWNFKYTGQVVDKHNIDHRGFLQWMLSKDFTEDTKNLVRTLLQ